MSTRPGTISEQLINAVTARPGTEATWLARSIGNDNAASCSALLCKLASRGVLRREGPTRPYRYYPGDVAAIVDPEPTPEEPAARGGRATSIGPSWTPSFPAPDDESDA